MNKAHTRKTRASVGSRRKGTLTKLDLSKTGGTFDDGTDGHGGMSQRGRAKGDGTLALSLRAVRRAAGRTQNDVSRLTGIAQGDVSRLEQRINLDECQISTLRRFVVALGGRLDVKAVFAEDRVILLTGWADPDL